MDKLKNRTMENNNKNVYFFEGESPKEVFEQLEIWQVKNKKRFLQISLNLHRESWHCIALSNPSEVYIKNVPLPVQVYQNNEYPLPVVISYGTRRAAITNNGELLVKDKE